MNEDLWGGSLGSPVNIAVTLAVLIARLAADTNLNHVTTRSAREAVLRRFSVEHMASEHRRLFP
jgi:hypothetical protein